jgi:eukaryotic-like serine/threonine-protein kinase
MRDAPAPDDPRLVDLLLRWEELRHQGLSAAAEELCSRCPELEGELRRRIEALEALDRVLTTDHEADLPRPAGATQSGPGGAPQVPELEILGELGHGSMGVVYRAHDRRRGQFVALKTMQHLSPSALYRFKQEFRTLAGVAHPNLVTLHELSSDGHRWFFTMELVKGVDILEFVRVGSADAKAGPGDAEDREFGVPASLTPAQLARLRATLPQLVEGISALHEAGKLHRDIKPSNVLVTERGRVVLLDFGLAAELEPTGMYQSTEAHILGTARYMAPEQAAGLAVSPAADWYSVGVMLYETLTGRPPFSGRPLDVLRDKQAIDPPPPRELAAGIPGELDALCVALLRRDPAERPSGSEIRARLGGGLAGRDGPTRRPGASGQPVPFVGRSRHLEALREAIGTVELGRTVTFLVHGRSGMGKTALVQHFLDDLTAAGEAVILAGRCYERESVPYKALDSVADALARYLRHLPGPEAQALLPRDILSLARVFPVLRRAEAVDAAPRGSSEVPDPHELRRRAFAALRELLARLGDRRTLVLFIDDLQWGDADSTALLADLLRPPDPPLLLLLVAYRSEDVAANPGLRALAAIERDGGDALDHRELSVEALAPDEARRLAESLLEPSDPARDELAAIVARESGGNPFFVAELVRHVQAGIGAEPGTAFGEQITLVRVLWARILRLPPEARHLLEIIAVAGRPLAQSEACLAAEVEGEGRGLIYLLGTSRLIRSTGPVDRDQVETYHDRVRETVVAHLSPEVLADRHGRIASVLERSGTADPEVLAAHLEAAGATEAAGAYYATAGARAAQSLAFDRAVALYQRALDLRPGDGPGESRLRAVLGDALANAGRGAEAAAQYLVAAGASSANESLDLRCKATKQLLISGKIDEGLGVLDGVLRSLGLRLPSTSFGAFSSLLLRRLQIRLRGLRFRAIDPGVIAPDDLRKLDICWSAAMGLGIVDYIRAFDFHSRHFLLALRVGEPHRIAKSLAYEATHLSVSGVFKTARIRKVFRAAERLAGDLKDDYIDSLLMLARGCEAFMVGRWTAAHASLARAEELFVNSCTEVTWELDTTRSFLMWSLVYMGSLAELGQRLPAMLREAEARGDLYFLMNLSTDIRAFVMAGHDEPGAAREALSRVERRWSPRGFHIQHHNLLLARVFLDLYEGDGKAAWNYISERWPAYRRSGLLHAQQTRIDVYQLWARSALVIAARSADPVPFLITAERTARRLERERIPWATAHAHAIRAGIAMMRDDRAGALTLLQRAVWGFEVADMLLYASVARRRLGEVLGGTEGCAHVEEANRWMAGQGVRRPGRITSMYMPGFPNQG